MNQKHFEKSPLGPVASGKPVSSPAAHDSKQDPAGSRGVHGSHKKRVCFGSMAVVPEEPVAELPRKRLRPNNSFMMQGAPPPDPLDADPLDLVASQSHLLERPSRLLGLERGNSSNCQHLEPLPPANIQDLQDHLVGQKTRRWWMKSQGHSSCSSSRNSTVRNCRNATVRSASCRRIEKSLDKLSARLRKTSETPRTACSAQFVTKPEGTA